MTITLDQVRANGGWAVEIQPRAPLITPPVVELYAITLDPNDWSVVHGMPGYDASQARLIVELDSSHRRYNVLLEDGDYVNRSEACPSDMQYPPEWSPYGSPSPTANRRPFPGFL